MALWANEYEKARLLGRENQNPFLLGLSCVLKCVNYVIDSKKHITVMGINKRSFIDGL